MDDDNDASKEINSEKPKLLKAGETEGSSEVKCNVPNSGEFKKPSFIGPRRGKIAGKVRQGKVVEDSLSERREDSETDEGNVNLCVQTLAIFDTVENKKSDSLSPAQKFVEQIVPLPYKEPKWGGLPKAYYKFEILKCGKIIETVELISKSFFVFGRLSTCDIMLTHPTISRYHAVMQFRREEDRDSQVGFYIYDLNSTHGTFVNKYRIIPNKYVRVQGCKPPLMLESGWNQVTLCIKYYCRKSGADLSISYSVLPYGIQTGDIDLSMEVADELLPPKGKLNPEHNHVSCATWEDNVQYILGDDDSDKYVTYVPETESDSSEKSNKLCKTIIARKRAKDYKRPHNNIHKKSSTEHVVKDSRDCNSDSESITGASLSDQRGSGNNLNTIVEHSTYRGWTK